MAKFTKEQIEHQITDEFIRSGIEAGLARSLAIRGADHYIDTPNATVASSLVYAKTYFKSLRRVRGKPAMKKGRK